MEIILRRVTAFMGGMDARADNSHNINFEKRTNLLYLLKKTNFAGVLYVASIFLITLGVISALAMNWNDLGQTARLSIIILCGVNAYIIGAALCFFKKMDSLGQALWFLSSVLLFYGLVIEFALVDSLDNIVNAPLVSALGISMENDVLLYITLPLFVVYLGSFLAFKRNILLIPAVFFGFMFLESFVGVIVGEQANLTSTVSGYMFLVEGVIYILLGYLFSRNEKRYLLTWPFYFFGAVSLIIGGSILMDPLALLGPLAGLTVSFANITNSLDPSLGIVNTNVVWVVLYPILALAITSLAFFLRKAWFVVAGSYALLSYVSYVVARYLDIETALWLSWILMGVVVLLAGQAYFYVKRRKVSPLHA